LIQYPFFFENEKDPIDLSVGFAEIIYADNRFRPLALLRFKTFMPPFVRILTLKPWVRALFILLG
jgi:hypothetical protein